MGQIEFFLNGGSFDCCLKEMASIVAGIETFLQECWREQCNGPESVVDYDEWRDEWCSGSTVRFKLVEVCEMFVNVKNIRDACRNGSVEQLKLSIDTAIEYAAASGADVYVRLYTDFLIFLETCSDHTLALLPDLLFVDFGSVYIGNDLLCEYFNLQLRKGVPVYRNALQWAAATAQRAHILPRVKPNFGGGIGKACLPSIGSIRYNPRMARLTFNVLQRSNVHAEGLAATFTDSSRIQHPIKDANGRGADQSINYTLGGGGVYNAAYDSSLTGRAILDLTLSRDVFGSIQDVQGVERHNIPRTPKTAADELRQQQQQKRQVEARSKNDILLKDTGMTKGEIMADATALLEYSSCIPDGGRQSQLLQHPPERIKGIDSLDRKDPNRRKYQPVASAGKPEHALGLARLKGLNMGYARAVLHHARETRGNCVSTMRARLAGDGKGSISRRERARSRVKSRMQEMRLAPAVTGTRSTSADYLAKGRTWLKAHPNIVQTTAIHKTADMDETYLRPSIVKEAQLGHTEKAALRDAADCFALEAQRNRMSLGRHDEMQQRRREIGDLREGLRLVSARQRRHENNRRNDSRWENGDLPIPSASPISFWKQVVQREKVSSKKK